MTQVMTPGAAVDTARLQAALDEQVDGEVRFDLGTLSRLRPGRLRTTGRCRSAWSCPRTVDAARGGGRRLPGGRGAGAVPWRRHQPGRPVRQHRGRHRLDQVLPPAGLVRQGGQDRHRAARRGAGQGQRRAGAARPDGRPQAVHARELHHRRHDREQLVRVHRPGLRQDGRLGAPAGDALLRRAAHLDRRDQRRGVRGDPRGRRRQGRLYRRLREIRDAYLGEIRTGYPKIPRRVSGYNLDQLLPRTGSTWPGHWSAARARWSPCCTRR